MSLSSAARDLLTTLMIGSIITFVGDDVVAKCVSNLKNKAALDTQKCANLGLKCVRMRLATGPDVR